MLINGVDILSLFPNKIQFLDFSLPNPSWQRLITTMDTDFKIVNQRGSVGITNMVVRMAFFDTKENSYIMASKIVSLLDDAIVQFETNGLRYRVQVSQEGKLSYKYEQLSEFMIQLQIMETMGALVSVNGVAGNVALVNSGSYKTPIKIVLTPSADIASLNLQGFLGNETSPLTITSLHNGRRVIVDGETRLIQEETAVGSNLYVSKFLNSNITYFPEIKVGNTTLTYTPTTNITVNVQFSPRHI